MAPFPKHTTAFFFSTKLQHLLHAFGGECYKGSHSPWLIILHLLHPQSSQRVPCVIFIWPAFMSSRSVDLHDHYLNSGVPDEITENLLEFFPNDDGLSYEEVLLQQASMFQSFQERARNNNKDTYYDDDDISNWGHLLVDEGESSRNGDVMKQEAIDEALARSLQDLGEGFDDLVVSELSGSASESAESRIATPARAQTARSNSREDPVDPDSMQYEELLQLAESVGVENRGISAMRISQLPTSKYRSGLFSKNKKKEENCVICQMDFSYGDRLITLPCLHQYHTKCISDWLKLKKNCPICQKEVV